MFVKSMKLALTQLNKLASLAHIKLMKVKPSVTFVPQVSIAKNRQLPRQHLARSECIVPRTAVM
jgi:hypothetical protein